MVSTHIRPSSVREFAIGKFTHICIYSDISLLSLSVFVYAVKYNVLEKCLGWVTVHSRMLKSFIYL
jgi:hypothetical protein